MERFREVTAEELVETFAARLQRKADDVACIASFWNSFEGWLKWELALELCQHRERRPWSDDAAEATYRTIGVECKVDVVSHDLRTARKQVDLWVCSMNENSWHYIELKVAFANSNRDKQMRSLESDLLILESIIDPSADGRVALLIAVGFSDETLSEMRAIQGTTVNEICKRRVSKENATPCAHLISRIKYSKLRTIVAPRGRG